ncbi:MAG: hypothetical protein EGS44_12145 [Akkermansia muciniphila]|nr:hypothetical protein [Akkermansia muciniphila]
MLHLPFFALLAARFHRRPGLPAAKVGIGVPPGNEGLPVLIKCGCGRKGRKPSFASDGRKCERREPSAPGWEFSVFTGFSSGVFLFFCRAALPPGVKKPFPRAGRNGLMKK